MSTRIVTGFFAFAAMFAMFAGSAQAQVLEDAKYTFTNAKSENGAVATLYTTLHLVKKVPHPFRKGEEVGIYKIETNIGWMSAADNKEGTEVNMKGQKNQASDWLIVQSSKGWSFTRIPSGENCASLVGIKPEGGGSATGAWKLRRANAGGKGQQDQVFEMKEGHVK